MADVWGNGIKLAIFGESHGAGIGIVIDGLAPGQAIDMQDIAQQMARRAPGTGPLATSRREEDEVEIISGLYRGKTTGSALCGIIRNKNVRSGDYGALLRPGHADWTALLKYAGHADMRGGGHFSGRLTAPLVFAGAIAQQLLRGRGVGVYARITGIGTMRDTSAQPGESACAALQEKAFPVLDEKMAQQMQQHILDVKAEKDAVGGSIEVLAFNVPGGLGNPFFASFESVVASLFFSIPAVKGLEFGDGFALAQMRASQANDALHVENGRIKAKTNHSGGILGGITSGMPIVARLAIKPTPSIALPQESVNPATMENAVIQTHGRHDPCIVPRAVPVAQAAMALAILDLWPQTGGGG